MDLIDWVLVIGRVVVVFAVLMLMVMFCTWMERKVIADMQTRMGPMRAGPRGILQPLADGAKLFFKEGITPTGFVSPRAEASTKPCRAGLRIGRCLGGYGDPPYVKSGSAFHPSMP